MTIITINTKTEQLELAVREIHMNADVINDVLYSGESIALWLPQTELEPLHREIMILHRHYPALFPIALVHSKLKANIEFQNLVTELQIKPQVVHYIVSISDSMSIESLDISNLEIQDTSTPIFKASTFKAAPSFKDGLRSLLAPKWHR